MAAKIYLGYPPENIRKWIKNYYTYKLIVTFSDGTTKIIETESQTLTEDILKEALA